MRVQLFFATGAIIASIAAGGGCATKTDKANEPQPAMRAMGQPAPSAGDTGETPTNESIGFEIRRQLNADPTTSAGIIVEVDDGTVTLRGAAPTMAAAWRAEAVAHAVKGVKVVINRIAVKNPTTPL